MSESRTLKKSVRSKRAEIDSLQSVINKVKNAMSVDDIDNRVGNSARVSLKHQSFSHILHIGTQTSLLHTEHSTYAHMHTSIHLYISNGLMILFV